MDAPTLEENADPITTVRQWLADAEATEVNDANAMALATATADGKPSVRMVLLKKIVGREFHFFTNIESRKGHELMANPVAALCLHWKSQRRQVRVEGKVTMLDEAATEHYFHTRSRQSQISASVSQQSRPLPSWSALKDRVDDFTREHGGEIPLPQFWRGFAVHADSIELWKDGRDRLHERMVYRFSGAAWSAERLYP